MNSDQGLFNESIHVSTRVNDFQFHRELIDQRIEQMRKEDPALRKMSYDCIAEKVIGLSRTMFFRIRSGTLPDPKASTAWLISSALDIPVCELLGLPSHETVHGSVAANERIKQLEQDLLLAKAELDRVREKSEHLEKMYQERCSLVTRLHNDLTLQRKVVTGILIALIALVPVLAIAV